MSALSPQVSLATQVHSQPGVFAVLLGSGVSTGAGMPTGWQVVKELVRRAAVAHDPGSSGPDADAEVEAWWASHGSGELGYAGVLEALAPTAAGRQALMEGFFDASENEDGQRRVPSAAHRALARLVASGSVSVILTTNFDRLMEQALEEVGIHPQVVSRPEAVRGMKPLAHAPATLIKLHGDYKDLTTLNTPAELDAYPAEWQKLVGQVLDEYGLVIAGWSAEWDTALVRVIEASPSRRYPLYWDSRSSRGAVAQRLLTNRAGLVLPSSGADELFSELESSVAALERLSEPPLSTAMAVARLKRHLHDPVRRIDVHDLVTSRIDMVRDVTQEFGARPVADIAAYDDLLVHYREAVKPLLELLVTGVKFDNDGTHERLWGEVLDRLLAMRRPPEGTFNDAVWQAQHYPALLAFYVMGAAAIATGNERLFISLARDHAWTSPFANRDPELAAHVLRPDRVLEWENINQFSRWDGTSWQQPPSHLVRADLVGLVAALVAGPDTKALFDDLEYRHSVLVSVLPGRNIGPLTGEYRGDRNWGGETLVECGRRFRATADRAGAAWPWWSVVGEDLELTLTKLEEAASR